MKPSDFSIWSLDPTKGTVFYHVIFAIVIGFAIFFAFSVEIPSLRGQEIL